MKWFNLAFLIGVGYLFFCLGVLAVRDDFEWRVYAVFVFPFVIGWLAGADVEGKVWIGLKNLLKGCWDILSYKDRC